LRKELEKRRKGINRKAIMQKRFMLIMLLSTLNVTGPVVSGQTQFQAISRKKVLLLFFIDTFKIYVPDTGHWAIPPESL
jgi:hypothetical protein